MFFYQGLHPLAWSDPELIYKTVIITATQQKSLNGGSARRSQASSRQHEPMLQGRFEPMIPVFQGSMMVKLYTVRWRPFYIVQCNRPVCILKQHGAIIGLLVLNIPSVLQLQQFTVHCQDQTNYRPVL
jgi:hypothetical protein